MFVFIMIKTMYNMHVKRDRKKYTKIIFIVWRKVTVLP